MLLLASSPPRPSIIGPTCRYQQPATISHPDSSFVAPAAVVGKGARARKSQILACFLLLRRRNFNYWTDIPVPTTQRPNNKPCLFFWHWRWSSEQDFFACKKKPDLGMLLASSPPRLKLLDRHAGTNNPTTSHASSSGTGSGCRQGRACKKKPDLGMLLASSPPHP